MGDNDFPIQLAGKYIDDVMAKPQRDALDLSRYRASGARKVFYTGKQIKERADGPKRKVELGEDQRIARRLG